uniref:Sigma54 specific transcriptional regulator, Fis family n=1 Tax=Leptospirillum ferrodiazotrophum TaxID=412449 RepID=C6HWP3_9BACT|nr:MAG: sigma54 specific transcriptional regulator, Fis family [Leptospirillum ferrodiazotrophum]
MGKTAPPTTIPIEEFSGRFVGQSKRVRELLTLVARVAKSDSTVLITGESGTGKERIARILHEASPRAHAPFVPVNCGAIPEGLMESELFGHEKGAFTGAVTGRPGRFELANGGTIFFDEIGELPLPLQVKLLRVLQEKTYERVGGVRVQTANVRVLAATHRNLEEMSREGRFREDLFYRLSVIPVEIPPLRERREDIPLLMTFFQRRWEEEGRGDPVELGMDVQKALCDYPWPGNVRELENVMERLHVLYGGETVTVDLLPEKIRQHLSSIPEPLPSPMETSSDPLPPQSDSSPDAELPVLLDGASASLLPDPARLAGSIDAESDFSLTAFMGDIERTLVQKALERAGGNRSKAAELLGINRTTLIEKLKRFGIS